PLGMPEGGRAAYVYLAELALLLLFTQARLTVPELFRAYLLQYWMLLVMGLAFAGIGLAELFERRGLTVLSVPLGRTAVLLPIIRLAVFWLGLPDPIKERVVARVPGTEPFLRYMAEQHDLGKYAAVWFLASGLYLLVAGKRRSFGWALTAALAANFGLW